MPFSIFKNPFEKAKQRKTDDAELVGELLGPEEEAAMREALGKGPESHRERDDTIRLTKEEEAAKRQVEEEVSPKQRWKEYVEWAEEFGRSDEWVGETFTFNDDGGVEVEGSLKISYTDITRLPKGLKSIGGGLDLSNCTGLTSLEHLPPSIGDYLNLSDCTGLISLEHLPSSIGGSLNLGGCTGLTSLEHLPSSIGGHLDLSNCTQIKDMPDGIKIGKEIILDKNQAELIANVKAKGYEVAVVG